MKKYIFLVIPILCFASPNEDLLTQIGIVSPKKLEQLLEQGADINSIDPDTSYSVLMKSLIEGNTPAANWLIENGANVNYVANDLSTALIKAAEYGNTTIIKKMLPLVKNIAQQDQEGSALHHAAKYGFLPIVKLLITTNNVNTPTVIEKYTLLMLSAYGCYNNVIKYLFKNFENIDTFAKNIYDDTALTIALKRNYYKTVSLLLKHNPPIGLTNKLGQTPLMIAAQYGADKSINELINIGCRIDQKDLTGKTALLWSAESNQVKTIQKLISAGADVDNIDADGNTSLIIASKYEQKELLVQLLKLNANASLTNKDGQDALDIAEKNRNSELTKILSDYMNKKNSP